jgi:hypothetical protein
MGEMRIAYNILSTNLNRRDLMGDPGIDEEIIIKWILKK